MLEHYARHWNRNLFYIILSCIVCVKITKDIWKFKFSRYCGLGLTCVHVSMALFTTNSKQFGIQCLGVSFLCWIAKLNHYSFLSFILSLHTCTCMYTLIKFIGFVGFTVTTTRKLMESICLFGAGSSLLILSLIYASYNSFSLSFFLINFAFFTRGFEVAGSTLNATDLAPSFSGVLYGMMNTLASLAGNTRTITIMSRYYTQWNLSIARLTLSCILDM